MKVIVKKVDKIIFLLKIKYMKNFFLNLQTYILSLKSDVEKELSEILIKNSLTISTAESCTGGLVSSRLTDISGSSAFVKENYVTYSNEAKQKILEVSSETLQNHGAVSRQCALEMAKGLKKLTGSDIVLCTTGVAGPSTSEGKPVGLMYTACIFKDIIEVKEYQLNSGYTRKNMKYMFSEKALEFALATIKENLTVK